MHLEKKNTQPGQNNQAGKSILKTDYNESNDLAKNLKIAVKILLKTMVRMYACIYCINDVCYFDYASGPAGLLRTESQENRAIYYYPDRRWRHRAYHPQRCAGDWLNEWMKLCQLVCMNVYMFCPWHVDITIQTSSICRYVCINDIDICTPFTVNVMYVWVYLQPIFSMFGIIFFFAFLKHFNVLLW